MKGDKGSFDYRSDEIFKRERRDNVQVQRRLSRLLTCG